MMPGRMPGDTVDALTGEEGRPQMCRWLAYTGNVPQASAVILDAQHSPVVQSLNSPLGPEPANGDGFDFGCHPENTTPGTEPAFFDSITPARNDQNLTELTRSVRSPLVFSLVPAAAGPPIHQTNCHPFRYQNRMFMHNGFLNDLPGVFIEVPEATVAIVDASGYHHRPFLSVDA
jgi:predicted glutamine amidotransferase